MASISDDGGGLKRIQIVCPDGQRRAIRLGRMSMKQAKSFDHFVEDLCAAARGAKVIENATADWLAHEVRAGDAVLVMGGGLSYRIADGLLERLSEG